ncbi:MAG TPA: hypothetical protein VGO58_16210, partial [Chitinophagaceae bacterium]|nr:hypothetical protein [Chitinophagaceae bacterium]
MISANQIKEFLEKNEIVIPGEIIVHRVLRLGKNEYYNIILVPDPGSENTGMYLVNDDGDT